MELIIRLLVHCKFKFLANYKEIKSNNFNPITDINFMLLVLINKFMILINYKMVTYTNFIFNIS